jgi:hypothetical protein
MEEWPSTACIVTAGILKCANTEALSLLRDLMVVWVLKNESNFRWVRCALMVHSGMWRPCRKAWAARNAGGTFTVVQLWLVLYGGIYSRVPCRHPESTNTQWLVRRGTKYCMHSAARNTVVGLYMAPTTRRGSGMIFTCPGPEQLPLRPLPHSTGSWDCHCSPKYPFSDRIRSLPA